MSLRCPCGNLGSAVLAALLVAAGTQPTVVVAHGMMTHPPTRFPNAGPDFAGMDPVGSVFCELSTIPTCTMLRAILLRLTVRLLLDVSLLLQLASFMLLLRLQGSTRAAHQVVHRARTTRVTSTPKTAPPAAAKSRWNQR